MDFRCRECNELVDPEVEPVIVFHHVDCYDKFLKQYKEYGIRIGMREHGRKKKLKGTGGVLK